MFGAIIFIPLFLQLVYGVSPTSSGLRMLPLMAGLLTAQHPLRPRDQPDRPLQVFPIAGTAVTTVGMFLLSRLEVDTPPWLASVYMLVLGVGIGLVMQVLVLVVQNDAPPQDIGVATSTATFFRSHGRLARRRAVRRDLRRRGSRTSSSACRGSVAARLGGGVNISPDEVHALPARDPHDFLHAFVDALQPVFLVGAALTLVAFVLVVAAARRCRCAPPRRRRPDPVTDPGLDESG